MMEPILLSPELKYLRAPAVKFGHCTSPNEFDDFIAQLSTQSRQDLAQVSECIRAHRHQRPISVWLRDTGWPADVMFIRVSYHNPVFRLMLLLDELAERKIAPFPLGAPFLVELPKERRLDWNKLPQEVSYIIPAAEKYGVLAGEDEIVKFLQRVPEEDVSELASLYERMSAQQHTDLLQRWFDRYPFPDHPEASLVYSLLLLMDAMDLGGYQDVPWGYRAAAAYAAADRKHVKKLRRLARSTPAQRRRRRRSHEHDRDLYCPNDLPDPTTEIEKVVALLGDPGTPPRQRRNALELLLNCKADSAQEARDVASALLRCVRPSCETDTAGFLWGHAFDIMRVWRLIPDDEIRAATPAGYGPESDLQAIDFAAIMASAQRLLGRLGAEE